MRFWRGDPMVDVRRMIAVTTLMMLLAPRGLAAQEVDASAAWRRMAEQVDAGTDVVVRLRSGQRFRATLLQGDADKLLIQPKTRLPVPPQAIPYESIVSLERRSAGMGAAKAAAIGVGTGVGAFFG